MAKFVAKETEQRYLCLAGGVALNCVSNSKILNSKIFDQIWTQPASGDSGCAIGAALASYYIYKKQPRHICYSSDKMQGAYLGPSFSHEEILVRLKNIGAKYTVLKDEKQVIRKAAKFLSQEKIIGWFQGRAEFGPRSLGNRSIIADPRSPHMQKTLNLKIKYRESFRPFAPSILVEDLKEWFDLDINSPYMLFVANVLKTKKIPTIKREELTGFDKLNFINSMIPTVTHVDNSARVQTVSKETNNLYYDLIMEFKKITGCPVIVNTSFNVRGGTDC